MPDQNQINALISLIDDPDEAIYEHIRSKLLDLGEEVIPALENYWENNQYGLVFQNRIENIIHQIQFDAVKHHLKHWADNGCKDLLQGVLLVNKYQYPDLDEAKLKKRLHQIKQDVWLELHDNLTAFEQVRVINHVLFDVHGFSANKKNFHAAQNSYLNNVLESGKGNPLTLSIIYILICDMLEIPVYGVNLPNHFVLCYLDTTGIHRKISGEDDDVMFYINPFSRGTIFNRREIDQFLQQLNLSPQPEFYQPCGNRTIVKRLITNLIYSYEKLGYADKVDELKTLFTSLSEEGTEENPEGTL